MSTSVSAVADSVAPVLELGDPLAEALGGLAHGATFRYTFADAVKLCGHSCPTVAGAWLMAARALAALYPGATPERGQIEVTVGGERDDGSSGPIALVLGLVTGAAPDTGFGGLMGKWRRKDLLHFEPGLAGRVRFRRVDTGVTVETAYDPGHVPPDPDLPGLLTATLTGQASPDDRRRLAELWQSRVAAILSDPARVVTVRAA
jgi:hypothetical protein